MQITSLGWFGHHNVGDEAFRYALRQLFPSEIKIKFVDALLPNLTTINAGDHLLIGGGNIVDREFLKGLERVRVPYSFIGVGIVSGNDLSLLPGASNVLVRDKRSLALASSVYPGAVLSPDLAFTLGPMRDVGREFLEEESGVKFKRPVVGKMRKGYNYRCLTQEINPIKVLSMVSSLDFAITMRLHASIFCTIAGIPFIDILHHDKSKGYLDELGMPEVGVDFYELSLRVLAEKFAMLEQNRESISQRLLDTAAQNKRNLEGLIENVHLP